MIDRAISLRYAKALFDLDGIKGQLIADFECTTKALNDHPKLLKFLKSPISLIEKREVFQNLLGKNLNSVFIHFIFYLIQKGRLDNLQSISQEYKRMVNEYLGVWEVDIVSAVPIDADSELKLKEKLERDFSKKISLNKTVNPKIIGGAILVIENEMLDWSVASRVRKLKESLMRVS